MLRRQHDNPLRIDVRYKPEEVEEHTSSRAVRSLLSPALQRRNVERMVDTPHNFVVVIAARKHEPDPRRAQSPVILPFRISSPDAVTLGIRVPRVAEDDNYNTMVRSEKPFSESLYTAFTYLHKLGDILTNKLCGDGESRLRLLYPSDRPKDPLFKPFYRMIDSHLEFFEIYNNEDRERAYEVYIDFIATQVNSKMVREGYSMDWTQAFADIFALCELTPASRPLLLPVAGPSSHSEQDVFVFNQFIVADFNKRFRAFYNTLIPSLYGRTFWLV